MRRCPDLDAERHFRPETLDTLDEPVEFLIGGDDLLAKIDAALQGKVAGDELRSCTWSPKMRSVTTTTNCCFWSHATCSRQRSKWAWPLKACRVATRQPLQNCCILWPIYPEHVVMDANHPLAGIAIRIQLKVHAVREATLDEIGKGSLGVGFFQAAHARVGIQKT